MTIPVLDLENFESDVAEGCEYVLTSPRSLQACQILNIKPIQLLRVMLTDILNENPAMSIRDARDRLMEENERRNELLQQCRMARHSLINGTTTYKPNTVRQQTSTRPTPTLKRRRQQNKETPVAPSKSESTIGKPSLRMPSPNRSISSPNVGLDLPASRRSMKGVKSSSVPSSIYSTPVTRRSQCSTASTHDRLVSSLLRKYSDRKREVKHARKQWLKWEEEKIEFQNKKILRQKQIQTRAAKNRLDFNSSLTEMVASRDEAADKQRDEKEARIKEKMRRAELNAREQRAEREQRIKDNAAEEERKMARQRERLEAHRRQKELKEKELAINLDKKLTDAEKQRKITKLREAEAVQRRNKQTRKQFELNYSEVETKREEDNRRKETELKLKLDQAQRNNKLLMEQRSEAIRVAAGRKRYQINEAQAARDILERQQHEKIERELLKNKKEQELALQGLEKLRLQRLDQAKEKHEQERLRALQNLEKSKMEHEQERALLERSINKKSARTEQLRKDRERNIMVSKTRAQREGIRRELLKKDLETFDERARRAEIYANMIAPAPSTY